MKLWALILSFLLLPSLASAGLRASKVAESCRALTDGDRELLPKCVNHAELFEVDAKLIREFAGFHRDVEIRMKALKSGADSEGLALCKEAGWNLENTLSCLRSYPTRSLLKSCKKLSPNNEDEQLKCLRLGRETAEVDACAGIGATTDEAFRCLEIHATAMQVLHCKRAGLGKPAFRCLNKIVGLREEEFRRSLAETKIRVAEEERFERASRGLASPKAPVPAIVNTEKK